jgi:hypothetical protein
MIGGSLRYTCGGPTVGRKSHGRFLYWLQNDDQGRSNVGNPNRELVQFVDSEARIVNVTSERIDYIDAVGQERSIHLAECAKNWSRWRDENCHDFQPMPGATGPGISAWNARCVGQRGSSVNRPWVEFMNDRQTRFEFGTHEDFDREIRRPLAKAGWNTFDCD